MSAETDKQAAKLQLAVAAVRPQTIMDQGEFEFYTTTERGIVFSPSTPFEVWEQSIKSLTSLFESSGKLHFRTMCFLGDALNFGEATYGEEHNQAIDMTRKFMQLSAKTLLNVASIMASVPPERRHDNLSLSHHDAVAALDASEQNELLDKAEIENWSVAALKKEIKERHPKTKAGATRKVVIDLKSEEGLQHAAEKVADWFDEHEKPLTKQEAGVRGKDRRLSIGDWPQSRKTAWQALTRLAKIARRMGIAR